MIKNLIRNNRSYRRFFQDVPIEDKTLRELVDLARISPSAANRQPLKYMLSCEPEKNALVFASLAWAGYLKDWPGPPEGERPAAYIIILADTQITQSVDCDHGIAAQSILLGAVDKDLGGCILGAINKKRLREDLNINARYEILLVIALGRPKENVVLEDTGSDGNIEYYRDKNGNHHVPKRPLNEIIISSESQDEKPHEQAKE
jgi:nitroreductase